MMAEPKKSLVQRAVSRLMPSRGTLPEKLSQPDVEIEGNSIQGDNNTITILSNSVVTSIPDVQKTDVKIFPFTQVYITAQLPKEVAILYVQADGRIGIDF